MLTFFLGLLASPAAHHDGPRIPPTADDAKLGVPVARLEAHLEPCAPHQVKAVLFYYSLISLFVCHVLTPLCFDMRDPLGLGFAAVVIHPLVGVVVRPTGKIRLGIIL